MLADRAHNSRDPDSDSARADRLREETLVGFNALRDLGAAVSIFGSARTPRSHPYYRLTRAVARTLGEAGYAIITGGGGGLMEAANRGAADAGAHSVGLCIRLDREEASNPFVSHELQFHHFAARKFMFARYAHAFVGAPGGLGTLDELFEALTLIQTKMSVHFPVILLGRTFWQGLIDWLDGEVTAQGMLRPGELNDAVSLHVVDTPAEVLAILGPPPLS